MKSIKNFKKGMTLLETIVALGILIIGVVASLSLSASSLSYSQSAEQSLVVVSLAREGIEIVRTIRDKDGFSTLPAQGNKIVDSQNYFNLNTEVSPDINSCETCRLFLDANGVYNHSGGASTSFKRLIKISSPSANERVIVSLVSWEERGRIHQYQLETYLSDWK